MTTVACVLRSGGDFDVRWVEALRRGVAEHLPLPHRFVCLSDVPVPCERVPLGHDWPGWWAKVEVLGLPAEYGQVLYMDLDTLPIGDLSALASYDGDFALMRDLGRPKRFQSGVMAFRAGGYAETLHEAFRERAGEWMVSFRGDGEWLHAHADEPDALQDLYPGSLASWKWGARYDQPEGAALCLGHGQPRFSDPISGWAHKLWRRRVA